MESIFHYVTTITTVGSFIAGVTICWDIRRRGSTEDITPFTFLVAFSACNLWFHYGKLKEDSLVMLINTIGAVIFGCYLAFYVYYTKKRTWIVSLIGIDILALYLVVAVVNTIGKEAMTGMGWLCVLVQLLAFGAPLAGIRLVIQRQSTDTLPFTLIFFYLLVSLEWIIYGLVTNDMFLLGPNVAGLIISVGQLSLFCIYPSKSGSDEKDGREMKTSV